MEHSNDTASDKIENNIDNDKYNDILDMNISNQIQETEKQPSSETQNIQTDTIIQIENSNYKPILIAILVIFGAGVAACILYKHKKH